MRGRLTVDHVGGTESVDTASRVDLADVGVLLATWAAQADTADGQVRVPLGAGQFRTLRAADVDRIDFTWEL